MRHDDLVFSLVAWMDTQHSWVGNAILPWWPGWTQNIHGLGMPTCARTIGANKTSSRKTRQNGIKQQCLPSVPESGAGVGVAGSSEGSGTSA